MHGNTPAYRVILTYLVNHATIDEGATVKEIADGTKISIQSVYRIVADKRNGPVGDETVSPGIFVAPTSMRVNYGRPAKTYYADLKRIDDKPALNNFSADRVPLPAVFTTFEVTGRNLTKAMREVIRKRQETSHLIQDSVKPLHEQMGMFNEPAILAMLKEATANYEHLTELLPKMREAVQLAKETGTIEKDLRKDWTTNLKELSTNLAFVQTIVEYFIQHPLFDEHSDRMFEEISEKIDIGIPVIKERK